MYTYGQQSHSTTPVNASFSPWTLSLQVSALTFVSVLQVRQEAHMLHSLHHQTQLLSADVVLLAGVQAPQS